jgi:hypothetical protein
MRVGRRCKPLVAENRRHCFGTVIYNENTNHDVWTISVRLLALLRGWSAQQLSALVVPRPLFFEIYRDLQEQGPEVSSIEL